MKKLIPILFLFSCTNKDITSPNYSKTDNEQTGTIVVQVKYCQWPTYWPDVCKGSVADSIRSLNDISNQRRK